MADSADLEYLRLQSARKRTNQANGTQVLGQGGDLLNDAPTAQGIFSYDQIDRMGKAYQANQTRVANAASQRNDKEEGQWYEKAFGFIDEIAAQFGAGFVGAWEGMLDFAANAIGAVGEWTGAYDSTPFTDWAKQDLGREAAQYVKTYMNFTPWSIIRNIRNGNYNDSEFIQNAWNGLLDVASLGNVNRDETYDDDVKQFYGFNDRLETQAGQFAGGIAHSIGFMLPSVLTGGGSQVAQLASMGLSAAGKGSEEALNDGATAGQAFGYGVASGAAEVASEIFVGKLLGKIGLGTGDIGLKSSSKAVFGSKEFFSALGKRMFEEGMEEVSTAVLDPVLKSIYQGEEAYYDENGKPKYVSADFWFGADGHFNESVAGQFLSGAATSGLSGVAQSAVIQKSVGSKGAKPLQSWIDTMQFDAEMSELERKGKVGTKAYQEASEARTKKFGEFSQELNEFMQSATPEQLKNMARYLGMDGALLKDMGKGKADTQAIQSFFGMLQSENQTHMDTKIRSEMAQWNKRFGTGVRLEITDDTNAQPETYANGVITISRASLETEGGKLLAHAYFGHALGDVLPQGERTRFFNEIEDSDWANQMVDENGVPSPSGTKTWLRFITDLYSDEIRTGGQGLLEDEVIANYLQDMFSGQNGALQLEQLRQVFGKRNMIRRLLDWLNRVPKFNADAITKEYARSLTKAINQINKAVNNPLLVAFVKAIAGKDLTEEEEALLKPYGDLLNNLQVEEAEPQRASKERVTEGTDSLWEAVIEHKSESSYYAAISQLYKNHYDEFVSELNNSMSDQAVEYFADSVIRGGKGPHSIYGAPKGSLVPMFHGTNDAGMFYFDSAKIGSNGGIQRGHGFYATDKLSFATHFLGGKGKMLVGFLNIENPFPYESGVIYPKSKYLSFMENTNTKTQSTLDWFDEQDIFGEYKDDWRDWDIINQIYQNQTALSFDEFFKAVQDEFGHDGFVEWNLAEGTIAVFFNSSQFKDIINTNPTLDPDIRYSKKRQATQESEPEVKAEAPLIIPNSYIKDTADLYNDRVYSMNGVVDMIRAISKDMLSLYANVGPNKHYVSYDGKNIVNASKALFDVLNKKNVTPQEIVDAVSSMVMSAKIVSRDGKTVVGIAEFLDNQATWAEKLSQSVTQHLKDLVGNARDSFKAKSQKRLEALKAVYGAMLADLRAALRETKARIDASHSLRDAIKNVPEGMNRTYAFNENTLIGRTSSYLASAFLMLDYRGNGNFSTLLENQQELAPYLRKVLDWYNEKNYETLASGDNGQVPLFPYDADLQQAILDFTESVEKLGGPTTRENQKIYPKLTASQIKQANKILRAIEKMHKAVDKNFSERLRPTVIGAKNELAKHTKTLLNVPILGSYFRDAASFYAVINLRLGNSVWARELTIGMELADGKRKQLVGETVQVIGEKIKALKIEKTLAKEITYRGVKLQMGHLADLYATLTSIANFDALDKNGVDYVDPKKRTTTTILKPGEAEAAIKELRNLLPKEIIEYADWIKTELYNGKYKDIYYAYRDEGGYSWANVSEGYYPLSAHMDGPVDFTKMVKAPKVFANDELRKRHKRPFTIADITKRALKYANDLGMARYVLPEYRNNMYVLRQVWGDLNTANDVKFREALNTTLGMWVGLRPTQSSRGETLERLFGNYTVSLLAFNPGTPLKQTISYFFSNLSLPAALKGVGNRIFGGKEFRDKFNDLANKIAAVAYRARNSLALDINMETGYGRLFEAIRKVGEVGMKLIEKMDKGTIKMGLAASMAIVRDMGYSMTSADYESHVIEMFTYFVETQIGNNPSNLSRISRGDSAFGEVGRYLSFMQGPLRAALAAFVDKFTTWRLARNWTREGLDKAIADYEAKVNEAAQGLEEAKEALRIVVSARAKLLDEGIARDSEEFKKATAEVERAQEGVDSATEALAQAQSELDQARQNLKTFFKYKAQGGKGWMISTASAIMIGAFLNALIEALSKRLRGKEDWDEWNGEELWTKTWQYALFGWLPLASTITNAVQGYDTSYPAGALIEQAKDVISAFSNAIKNGFDEKSTKGLFRVGIETIGLAFGVPIKNIYQDTYGVVRVFSKDFADQMNGLFYVNHIDNKKIIAAIQDNQESMALRYIETMSEENCGSLSSELQKEYYKLIADGESPIASAVGKTYTNSNGEEITLTWSEQQAIKQFYSRANSIIARIIASKAYRSLKTSKAKSAFIRNVYAYYKQAAMASVLGNRYDGALTKGALLAKTKSTVVANICSAVAAIKALVPTATKSKKELAIAYVNGLSMTKNDRLLILYMAGYKVDENAVKQSLQSKGMKTSDIKLFMGQGEK